ncbi:AraC family transcriptional regulator [Compostibacter hankyongensis]|uniref:AraC family transcriptional regulator n=1 Tax=Compostibacter hankyongensis TaxID=1007089 RepID=A0ABP8FT34_9BACT
MKPILRKVDTGYNYSFSIREDIYPYLYNRWHYHPEMELTLIRKGSGTRLVGDSMEPFADGDLILLGPNLPHMWRSDAQYFQGTPGLHIEAIAIHFKPDFWGNGFLQLPELKRVRELLEKSAQGIRITGRTRQEISTLMEVILKAGDVKRISLLLNMLELIAQSKSCTLLSHIGFTRSYNPENTDNISAIYNYTLDHFQQKIGIRDVAALVNISPHSFCRYFKSRTLKTYWQFLLEVRIGHACKLLIENKLSISQICYTCGFNNLSNFNRQFRMLTGMTPTQYLKTYMAGLIPSE